MRDPSLCAAAAPVWPAPARVRTAFVPSRHGLPFANTWHDMFLGVVASRGRCGGMVFAALDHFHAEEPPPGPDPGEGPTPAHDSPLAHYIWRRQVASVTTGLGANLWSFVLLTYLPTATSCGIGSRARRDIGPLLDSLAAGRPVPLGLVSAFSLRGFFRNHQVLAVGAEVDGTRALIRVYDPNHPHRDDVLIEVPRDPAAPVVERVGSREITWRGLFIERYRPVRVSATARGALLDRAVSTRAYWVIGGVTLVAVWAIRALLRGTSQPGHRHVRATRRGR